MTLTTGAKLGPYEILSAIGAGGQGEVYRGRDTRLGLLNAGVNDGGQHVPCNLDLLDLTAKTEAAGRWPFDRNPVSQFSPSI